jgi:hypothetical protein
MVKCAHACVPGWHYVPTSRVPRHKHTPQPHDLPHSHRNLCPTVGTTTGALACAVSQWQAATTHCPMSPTAADHAHALA